MSNGGTRVGKPAVGVPLAQNPPFPRPDFTTGNVNVAPSAPVATSANPMSSQQNPPAGPLPQSPMIPYSQQEISPDIQRVATGMENMGGFGGKAGLPGQAAQTRPMRQVQQAAPMSQGLGALFTGQQRPQSSTNSLQ